MKHYNGVNTLESQKGFVLAFSLLMMLVLSLLTMHGLSSSQLEMKMVAHLQHHDQLFFAAERGLRKGEALIESDDYQSCQIPRNLDKMPTKRSKTWWTSSTTCHLSDEHYNIRYIIEGLEYAPCRKIKSQPDRLVRYFRISAYAQNHDDGPAIKLQSTYVRAVRGVMSCMDEKKTLVEQGRQSWREVVG